MKWHRLKKKKKKRWYHHHRIVGPFLFIYLNIYKYISSHFPPSFSFTIMIVVYLYYFIFNTLDADDDAATAKKKTYLKINNHMNIKIKKNYKMNFSQSNEILYTNL